MDDHQPGLTLEVTRLRSEVRRLQAALADAVSRIERLEQALPAAGQDPPRPPDPPRVA